MSSPGSHRPPAARPHPLLAAAMALTLIALIAHAAYYSFLCDDAFISFRYARNLAAGHGLVFNPGFERVEGYSNFLLVVMLAGLKRFGVAPEQGSLAISWLATVVLWGLMAGWVVRRPPPSGRAWLALAPLAMLAATRSIAVWSTSGLETRLFEVLAIGATLRLVSELSARDATRPPLASLLFALAALTRPDGLLIAAAACAVEAAVRTRRGENALRVMLARWALFALIVGGHFAFRYAYYGEWLPNTYYAKVGGRTWWDAGTRYLGAFVLEYAGWLWIPLAALGVAVLARARDAVPAVLLPAVVLVHVLYVAAIGGDHFEYRPLDLHIPLLFVLAYEGLKPLARPMGGVVAGALSVVVLVGLVALPWQTHVESPARYLPGFPGKPVRDPERQSFLAHPGGIYRLPVLRRVARTHRGLLRWLSLRFIGLRQEEHALFLREAASEGMALGRWVRAGLIPADLYIATASVGAIPYFSNLRTLDRLGLTDARVAHLPGSGTRLMAHDRSAPYEEAASRGVDLWAAHDVHLLFHAGDRHPMELVGQGTHFWVAPLDSSTWLVAWLPQGVERTQARTPRLTWLPDSSAAFLVPYIERGVQELERAVSKDPADFGRRRDLGYFLFLGGSAARALPQFETALRQVGDDPEIRLYLGMCRAELGDVAAARADLMRALELANAQKDSRLARLIKSRLEPPETLEAPPGTGAGAEGR